MKEFIPIFEIDNKNLIMTTSKAGTVGKSSDFQNKNRYRIIKNIGIIPENVIFVNQIHSKIVIDTKDLKRGEQYSADGIITKDDKKPIAITVADCMPIFLYDRKKKVRALLHSGWKGTGIVLSAIQQMKETYNCNVSDIIAYLGPSIKSCCYEVDRQRAVEFSKNWGDDTVVNKNIGWYLSIDKANVNILKKIGVGDIIKSSDCTCCNSIYGSYRRDGKENYQQMFVMSY